ncbi:MAG: hypothetical protein SWO11_22145 [Thermodesulfobacteriota bacterium]|nr:hypothetical protein [Thermodesulfobacteriota bacterium]
MNSQTARRREASVPIRAGPSQGKRTDNVNSTIHKASSPRILVWAVTSPATIVVVDDF